MSERVARIVPRDYQQKMHDDLLASPAKRKVCQMPTGSGKSVVIQMMIQEAERLVVMAHAEWLVDQLAERMPGAHQVIKAGAAWDKDGPKHIVGMVQTLRNRLDDIPRPDLVICDEHHHAVSPTYRKILEAWSGATVIGFTATPQRLDGQGLDSVADDLICGPQYGELIEQKYLKPFELYSVPSGVDLAGVRTLAGEYRKSDIKDAIRKSTIFGDVVDHWKRLGRDGGHASFWSSIEEAEHAAEQVKGWHALHSKMPKERIRQLIDGLRTGSVESVASVGMIGEGLDIPGLSSVSLCRPTKSMTIYMQHAGRCNRGGEGVARVFDHVQNWKTHGLPDDDRVWTLQGRIRKKREEAGQFPVWDCPECWAVNRSENNICVVCGTDKPRIIRETEQIEARLELITKADRADIHDLCETPEHYRQFAKIHKKVPGWAAYQFALRDLRRKPEDELDPFLAAAGTPRPSKDQFMRAAWQMKLSPRYAQIYAKHIHLT
ncbi:MAG: DEAD/DEAH box helicase [Geminicoccaceae bacterium]